MINSIRQEIVNRLLELYPTHAIYADDVPQKFKKPSFLIALIEQDYDKRLDQKSLVSFDVAYFSNAAEVKADCQEVQLNLFRHMDLIGGYRVLDKNATITDNVLHFTFNINYSEIISESYVKMMKAKII